MNLSNRTRKEAEERILENITIRCRVCQQRMKRMTRKNEKMASVLSEKTVIGYSCENCPRDYLFN